MKQNLVSLEFSAAQLEAVDAALAVLEENLAELVTLTAVQRRKALKMGDGSEVFCRQTELVLRQNVGMVPADFELAELQQDIATLDALRPRLQRLRTLTDRADDTELALGSDILSASLDGYALTKVIGQGTGLDTLKAAMKTRLARKPRKPADPAA
ncbi:hypothetical protein [Zoogloea sp.]|uniref:hypothetical protein n=1 Tax=Zoogloea sp. TaxID=49181 RepID=UPI002617006A|nr:hypothetical protein [uncultured Zoogloea sp.]MCK6387231.1 hypothetical protein [Zoogloea sp.]